MRVVPESSDHGGIANVPSFERTANDLRWLPVRDAKTPVEAVGELGPVQRAAAGSQTRSPVDSVLSNWAPRPSPLQQVPPCAVLCSMCTPCA